MTQEEVARKIGSNKGYVSGIENGKVKPPSVKIIKKFAKLFMKDVRSLVLLAWVDKAPVILRKDAGRFLEWLQKGQASSTKNTGGGTEERVP